MTALDYLAIAAYGAVVLFIGLRSARGHGSANDLLLGEGMVDPHDVVVLWRNHQVVGWGFGKGTKAQ